MTQEKLERAKEVAEQIAEWEAVMANERSLAAAPQWPVKWPPDMINRHRQEKIDYCQCHLEELHREFDAL